MMEHKAFASLSSGLLARKGAAKPAMRPQAFGQIGASLDDLGWNDMGHQGAEPAAEEHVPSSIAALTPAPKPVEPIDIEATAQEEEITFAPPVVAQQQRAIVETFGQPEEASAPQMEPQSKPQPQPRKSAAVVSLPRRRTVPAGSKAAFTLRLDPDRHFRLRLAVAVTGRSAQQIVTNALDELLQSIPEVEALAGQVPAKSVNRN
jgi:hypothetical protein